jgi:transcriptional regulator with XRE-family HTH domain
MRLEEKLVCLRKERHMTQLELAEKLDVSLKMGGWFHSPVNRKSDSAGAVVQRTG